MSSIRDQKVFEDLNFQIWQIKDAQTGKWRDEVYIMGDDESLTTVRNSLQGLFDIFRIYGKGTRKYKCNPPADFDHIAFGKENGVEIRWMDQLIVRLGMDALDDEPFILEDFVVRLNMSPNTIKQFIDRTTAYLETENQFAHGADAVCGLRFSPDWVGAE